MYLTISSSSILTYQDIRPSGLFPFRINLSYGTVGRTPWTGGQPTTRPLPTQDNTNTEETRTDINALGGIRTHDPSVSTGEGISCLRPSRHCDRQYLISSYYIILMSCFNSFSYRKIGRATTSYNFSRVSFLLLVFKVLLMETYHTYHTYWVSHLGLSLLCMLHH
jgi:hypothetical protein